MVNAIWPYIGGKRGLIVLAVGIAGAGMTMNWSWLVAAGVAPILLAVLPCMVMCALGLCMNKAGGKTCSAGDRTTDDATSPQVPPSPTPPSVAAKAGRSDLGLLEAEPRTPSAPFHLKRRPSLHLKPRKKGKTHA